MIKIRHKKLLQRGRDLLCCRLSHVVVTLLAYYLDYNRPILPEGQYLCQDTSPSVE